MTLTTGPGPADARGPSAFASPGYLRPLDILGGSRAAAFCRDGRALPLAGGPLAFTSAEVIVRCRDGRAGRRTASLDDLRAAGFEPMLVRLAAARPAVAGLALDRPRVMGVLNVTPDSFSDGGAHADTASAIAHGRAMAEAGADILDIGGESTRPGAEPVDPGEECDRVLPVIEGLRGLGLPLSIDTRNAEVMRAAVAAGCGIINDVSALRHDPRALEAAAATGVPLVLMHSRGDPRTMQVGPVYDDVLLDVFDHLEARIAACEAAGIPRQRLIVDPGIGFGKTLEHNLELLRGLALLHGLGTAVLLGVSRKGFIGRLSGETRPERRVAGSLVAGLHGLAQGIQFVRVHDVRETVQALAVWRALMQD